MNRADVVWALCAPEIQNRWRARAMRLAVRCAHPGIAPDAVAELMPTRTEDHQVLLAAFAEGLTEFADRSIEGVTSADIWELVAERAALVPAADVHAEMLTMVAECVDHGVKPAEFATRAITAGLDAVVATHVAAMIVGVLAGMLDLVRVIDVAALKLDPPEVGEQARTN